MLFYELQKTFLNHLKHENTRESTFNQPLSFLAEKKQSTEDLELHVPACPEKETWKRKYFCVVLYDLRWVSLTLVNVIIQRIERKNSIQKKKSYPNSSPFHSWAEPPWFYRRVTHVCLEHFTQPHLSYNPTLSFYPSVSFCLSIYLPIPLSLPPPFSLNKRRQA